MKATMKWGGKGSTAALLVKTSTDVDKTGKSYYGESGIYYMKADGSLSQNVKLDKEGPVHDAEFVPDNTGEFIIVFGVMPAVAMLFGSNGEPKFSFGTNMRNSIFCAPHGRFVAIAGFGNLRGGIDVWDLDRKKRIGSSESPCSSTFSWAASSRFFLTAVLSPRLRIDNEVKIFSYFGEERASIQADMEAAIGGWSNEKELKRDTDAVRVKGEFYWAAFAPAKEGIFPDRPSSPNRKAKVAEAQGEKAKAGAYVPPHLKGKDVALPSFRLREDDVNIRAGSLRKQSTSQPVRAVVGMGAEDVAKATKNRRKRNRNKKSSTVGEQKDEEEERAEPITVVEEAEAPKNLDPEAQWAKKEKALKKKLRQIVELQEKKKRGEELNDDQLAKIASQKEVETQLESLRL
uniref:Translation initiation factor beta propellor-like domain-containing protein n=1 Tax=Palpitomonas bilix TaxID=652834 RepID=A0A7S3D217_9EUKA|mmetsp:Transcript_18925/g.48170  ORF Transcript_18925/g.48170 Transcript_18925/m.48170 type:complete len:403 (+) Transcript_18925:725-1933(+)